MKIKIFNHWEQLDKERDFFEIDSMEDFLLKLICSDGDDDKPVRVVVDDTSKATIVKFGIKQREVSILDEINNLEQLSNIEIQHIAKFKFKKIFDEESACILAIEYVHPCKLNERETVHTFRDLSKTADTLSIKYAFFQVLFTLLQLQTFYPGFKHNDLKADNVLITNSPKNNLIYTVLGRQGKKTFRLRNCAVFAKIIDFELACTPDYSVIRSSNVLKTDKLLYYEFGLTKDKCDAFDIHLLIIDVLKHVEDPNFQKFINDFFPSCYFFKPQVTVQYRLSIETQKIIQKKIENRNFIFEMLCHPYFFDLRDDNLDIPSDFFIQVPS